MKTLLKTALVALPLAITAGAAQAAGDASAGRAKAAVCAACHGAEGQGLIGPNLTDAYWIHGNTNVDIFNVISNGVVEKGMAAWEAVYTPEQRAELVAFIKSIQGTNPTDAKAPEGELME